MNILISLICIILSFSLLKIFISKWKLIRNALLKYNDNVYLFDLLMFVCILKISLYYCLPSLTHIVTDWAPVISEGIDPFEVLIVYFVEFFSYLIYILTIQYFIYKWKPQVSISLDFTSKLFVVIYLIISSIYYFTSISFFSSGESPLDSIWMLMPFIRCTGVFLSLFLLAIGRKRCGWLIYSLASIAVLMFVLYAFSGGVRSLLVWPSIFFLYFVYVYNKNSIKRYIPICLFFFVFIAFYQNAIIGMRQYRDVNPLEAMSAMKGGHTDRNSKSLFEEIDFRFGAMTTYGVGYFRLYDRGMSAGLNPIINSLYAPIPRRLLEDKPVPCSYDGTNYGQGMYMAMAAAKKDLTFSMTEPATGAHAFWELGILGVILFSIIPGAYVVTGMKLFKGFGIISIPLFMSLFKLEYMEPKLWVSCIILQLFQINFPAYILRRFNAYLGALRLGRR